MAIKSRWIALLLALMLLGSSAKGAAVPIELRFDPSLPWKTLETEHFIIVFPEEMRPVAEEAAEIAERAQEFWAQQLGYSPQEKTFLVLTDQRDVPFASTRLFPQNVIALDHPFGFSWERLGSAITLEDLIFSEYGRLVDQARVEGLTADLKALLGKLIAPGLAKPLMFREGLAELIASDHSFAEMLVRAWVQADRFPSLAQLSAPYAKRSWPPAVLQARAMGDLFLRFLKEAYGPEIPEALGRVHAEYPLATLTMGALSLAARQSPQEIYERFRQWAQEDFERLRQQIASQGGVTARTRRSSLGFWSLWPVWSPSGDLIVYYHANGERLSGLHMINPVDGEDRALLSCECGPPVWLNESTLLYPRLTFQANFNIFYDLYAYELDTGQEQRLTYQERIFLVEPLPDGRTVLLARHEKNGRSSLVLFDLVNRSRRILREFDPDQQIHSMAVSPDGRRIALSLWKKGQGLDIYLMSPWRGELIPLTFDPSPDVDPAFSRDGTFLLFASLRAGVFDLYAYHLQNQQFFRVTRSLTGSFQPVASPKGKKLLFVSYDVDGFNLYAMEYAPEQWSPVSIPQRTGSPVAAKPTPQMPRERSAPYDAASTLLPTFWLPLLGPKHVGLFTQNEDPLGQQRYELTAGLNLDSLELFSQLSYTNIQALPWVHIQLLGTATQQRQRLSLTIPFSRSFTSERSLLVGIGQDSGVSELFLQGKLADLTGLDLFRRDSSLQVEGALAWRPEGISRRLTLAWEEQLQLPWAIPSGLPQLWFSVRAAWSDHETFRLGTASGAYLLRGYEDVLAGSHLIAANLEYRFPIWSIDWACCRDNPWPLFLDDLRGRLFLDVGTVGSLIDLRQLRVGLGLELQLKLVLGYGLAEGWLRLGLAYGLFEREPQISLRWGPNF